MKKKSICFLIWEIAAIPTSYNHILRIPLILSPPQDKKGNQDDKADQTDQDYQDYHDDQNYQDYQDDQDDQDDHDDQIVKMLKMDPNEL